jgi:integral membrane protein (TIGR01906 family)
MERAALNRIITVLLVLLSVSTAVMIYLSNLHSVAFDKDLYESKYIEYDIHKRFDKDTDLSKETAILLNYLEFGDNDINSDFFNEKEIIHLAEVRQLFRLSKTALNTAVIISIISLFLLLIAVKHYTVRMKQRFHSEYFKRIISKLLILTGAIADGMAILFAVMAFTFSSTFIRFHELFFRTDTWMLDPATDNLIRMFPESFFYDLFIRIVLMSVVFATILLVIGFIIKLGRPDFMKRGRAQR